MDTIAILIDVREDRCSGSLDIRMRKGEEERRHDGT